MTCVLPKLFIFIEYNRLWRTALARLRTITPCYLRLSWNSFPSRPLNPLLSAILFHLLTSSATTRHLPVHSCSEFAFYDIESSNIFSLPRTAFTPALAEPKRKPGRPKGSINRKRPLDEENGPWDHSPTVQKRPHLSPTTPSPILDHQPIQVHSNAPSSGWAVDAQTSDQDDAKRFYEFQWRALSLCSEFYSAAAELIVRLDASFVR